MARGPERDKKREAGTKRQAGNAKKGAADSESNKGLTLAQRKARDAEALRLKQLQNASSSSEKESTSEH